MHRQLFVCFLKEEFRLHSTLYSRLGFLAFPLTLTLVIFAIAASLLLFSGTTFYWNNIVVYATAIYFLLGFVSGSVGEKASEYLERRFGDFGRVFSNALLLPCQLRDIFFMSTASEIVFYVIWLIVPVTIGLAAALLIAGYSILLVPLFFLSSLYAFLFGIGISFFLSVAYIRSRVFFSGAIIAILLLGGASYIIFSSKMFLAASIFLHASVQMTVISTVLLILLFVLCWFTVGKEYSTPLQKKQTENSVHALRKSRLPFITKDRIDLTRTHGFIVKPLFNIVVPSFLIYLFMTTLHNLPLHLDIITSNSVFFAIMISCISVSFFNSLLTSDTLAHYVYLPITLERFIRSKLVIALVISLIIGSAMTLIYTVTNTGVHAFGASLLVLIGFLTFTFIVNFHVNGLHPNENSLNAVALAKLSAFLLPILLIAMVLPVFFQYSLFVYAILMVVLLGLSWLIYGSAIRKWNQVFAQ